MRLLWSTRFGRALAGLSMGCAVALVGSSLIAPDDRLLPDAESFLKDVRANLQLDSDMLDGYTYLERRTDADIGFFGGVGTEPPTLHRVYRSRDLGAFYRRLLEVDDEPLSDDELIQQDRRHRAELLNRVRRRARESENDRAKRLDRAAEAEDERRDMMEEVLNLFDYHLERRELLDGRPAIVVSFTPHGDGDPKTRQGKILAKSAGRAWVAEDDRQVIRVEAVATSDITIGLGLVARLHKGSNINVRRTPVGDRWLPAGFDFSGSGRSLLFRTFQVDINAAYSDYEPLTANMLPYEPIGPVDASETPSR